MDDQIEKGTLYRHYKGQKYRVLDIAKHSETLEDLIVYECLYPNDLSKIWVRPLKMFLGTVEINGVRKKRFTKLEE